MVELLKCVNAVLYNTDEKFKITPSLFSTADKNKMLPFLCVSFDTYTTTEKMQNLLFNVYAEEVIRNKNQKDSLNEIKALFDKNNIEYYCYKGFSLKELYPREELRFMSDLDIYVGKKQIKKANRILKKNGYKKIESWTHDITFSNDKNVILELHHSFQTETNFGKEHIESIMKNLKRKDTSFELSFENKNDEYIVLFFHLLRHQKLSGVGIKSFLDMYLFVKKYKEQLDFDYIHKVYESTKYYDDCLIIEEYIFDMFNDRFDDLSSSIIEQGVFGNLERFSENELNDSNGSKIKWLIKKMFPSITEIKGIYLFLNKGPLIILLPFCYLVRIIYYLTFGLGHSIKRIKGIKNHKNK